MRKRIVQISKVRTISKMELKLMNEINRFLKKKRRIENERKNRIYT